MSSYRAKAIILKAYKLGEADKIVKLYSQKNGLIDAVAKGARKIKSKFGGRLELFKFIFCQLISEIVLKMHFHTNEASPVLFKLIYVCFNEIDSLPKNDIYSIEKIACFFIAKFLKITGYAPIIENCISCDTPIVVEQKAGKISFSIKMGGVLCPVCSRSAENMPDTKK